MKREFYFVSMLALVLLTSGMAFTAEAEKNAEPPIVRLFDTGTPASQPWPGEALAQRTGWTQLPENETSHSFKGDGVLLNDVIAVALRQQGKEAELYSKSPAGYKLRARFAPARNLQALDLSNLKLSDNSPNSVSLNIGFKTENGPTLALALELNIGQGFIHVKSQAGVSNLRISAPCRFAILPDFFADDMVIDAQELPVAKTDLPGENFFLQMLDHGEAILMSICAAREQDFGVTLSESNSQRTISASEIPFGKQGDIWLAVLDDAGIWHQRDIAKSDAGKEIPLEWKRPFPAQWRMDWRRNGHLTDSWEMLVEQANGQYLKYGWLGSPEVVGTESWMHKKMRERWTTVLGSFPYPCWLDTQGQGFMQPLLKKVIQFEGPAILYPINRITETPLNRFTVVDIVRATLGVGPCEYILDLEGQKQSIKGIATCASRDKLNPIYAEHRQKQSRQEILKALSDVLAFVKHIRGRIEDYVQFGHEMQAYLDKQAKARPELASFIQNMKSLTGEIDQKLNERRDKINTPEYAEKLIDTFRTTLVDYEGADAEQKCKNITAAVVDVGGNQDELVGECRVAVKRLRQQAGLAMAVNPSAAELAKEIRNRTQTILRNPVSYEAARH